MTKEEIYDEQIKPLMAGIIDLCEKHKIAFIANFALTGGEDALVVTSARLELDCDPTHLQLEAMKLLGPKQIYAFAETTTTRPDGGKNISIRRIS